MSTGSPDSPPPTNALDRVAPRVREVEALMRRVDEEHGGAVLGPIVNEHLGSGGKRLRARLALATVDALGGDVGASVGWAAACELLHNATLVHDDLQDGDRVRRGHPTVWVQHGDAQAINAGDLLFLAPFLALDGVRVEGDDLRWPLARALAERGAAVIRGQAAEFRMASRADTGIDDYLTTVIGKTSGLFELPVVGGALIAGLADAEATAVASAFRPLGVLFQMQDDVLDLYGDKGREAPGADLREGKISALVVEHLAHNPHDREWLLGLLREPRDTTGAEAVSDAIERFRGGGALAGVLDRIDAQTRAVLDAPSLAPHGELRAVADALVQKVLAPIEHVRGVVTP